MVQTCATRTINEMNLHKFNTSEHRLLTVRQFCEQYPWPSESAMRAYIYRAGDVGLSKAFVRVGRRVLINVDKFFELVKGEEKNHG